MFRSLRQCAPAAIAIVLASIVAFTVLDPHPVTHWSLYAATDASAQYRLFLDPFPDAHSCDVDRRLIVQSGGRAVCRSRLALAVGRRYDDQLAWEFLSPANPFLRLCGRRSQAALEGVK
jgi:hypothetical protein